MVDHQSGPAAVPHTTTPAITGNLYEAAFRTTGEHPQCGVAIASTEQEARQRLAFMLFICDHRAPATADITTFTRAEIVRSYTGTVSEICTQVEAKTSSKHYTGSAGDIAAEVNTQDAR